ncbi:hypothetical protein ACWDEX_36720, partial [Streptomyces sp. NPDC001020]
AELMSIGEEIYDEYMAERIWPGTRALAQAHRPGAAPGHTASPWKREPPVAGSRTVGRRRRGEGGRNGQGKARKQS